MSQLTPQDIQSLQQLTSIIMPKIIERVKKCESNIEFVTGRLDSIAQALNELQLAVTSAAAAPAPEKKSRGRKKKVTEPELVKQDVPVEVSTPENPLPQSTGASVSVVESANGITDVGIAAVTQSGETVPPVSQADGSSVKFPVIEGITVDGRIVGAIQYIVEQGYDDAKTLAETLSLPIALVNHVLDMPIAEQAAIIEASQAQG